MTDKLQLLQLLEEVLGSYKEYKKHNEVAFFCPGCGHHKRKLQVNLETGRWHCWVCQVNNHMAGKSLHSLFRKINATEKQIVRLGDILGDAKLLRDIFDGEEKFVPKFLPKEFKSLATPSNSPYYNGAMWYLKGRGITLDDILKYNIGYAETGMYARKVIIPSYGGDGQLNFFVGRAFYHQDGMPHMMPSWSKDIVGFEAFINWKMPIVLVEGAFDAIAVKINAIPLFGKTVDEFLHTKIIQNNVRDIYICLDTDAIQNSMNYMKLFLGEGRNVYFVKLQDKDPSKIGFLKMRELIDAAQKMSLSDILRMRLG